MKRVVFAALALALACRPQPSGPQTGATSARGAVDGILRALRAGVRLIDETPRVGAEGKRIAFLHPSSTAGVLVELSEY